ncbi:MAG: transcription antitermination factor NusB [Lachnospiraceae bacterium]|nr:transcription antitermination factor NusB [Lachnospiraceae bacterium]
MKRQDIREHLFRLLFRIEFNPMSDMNDQKRLYFEEPTRGDEDGLDIVTDNGDEEYIKDKYNRISEMLPQLDDIINKASKGWSTERMGKADLTILRLAAYEVLFDDDIPTGVAIDQAVELAKKYGQDESAAFVNGILSGISDLADKS